MLGEEATIIHQEFDPLLSRVDGLMHTPIRRSQTEAAFHCLLVWFLIESPNPKAFALWP